MTAMPMPVHPGRIIRREIEARAISGHGLALDLGIPPDRISKILNGGRGITADTALRLGRYFATGPEFWMNLQTTYELDVAEIENGTEIRRTIRTAA
jgi:addiction module HigA family antidote